MQWPRLSQIPRKPPLPQSADELHAPLEGQNFGPATACTENETEARTPARTVRRKAFFMGSSLRLDADSSTGVDDAVAAARQRAYAERPVQPGFSRRALGSSGAFFWVWTLVALGVCTVFSVILSAHGLWRLQWGRSREPELKNR